jgi:hypothetical protein
MFEVPVDKQESKLKYERIGISILVLLVTAGALFISCQNKVPSRQPLPRLLPRLRLTRFTI